jgi:hypothetical protein
VVLAVKDVKLDTKAISEQIFFGEGVRNDLSRRANNVAHAAGTGCRSEIQRGRDRYRAAIWTATWPARFAEATQHRLLGALDAARPG